MMSEEKVLADLENNIPYDYCRSCDSEDGLYHEYIDEDSWQYKVKMLLKEKDKEIERLNNIINKFDKWLDEKSEKTILSTGHLTCLMMCKNKLQKLKGSE